MMAAWHWIAGSAAGLAVLLIPAVAVAKAKKGNTGGVFIDGLERAAVKIPESILAVARKWASARGLSLVEVMATILLESRGNPKARNFTAKEDSRGLMQVNLNAWKDVLAAKGIRADDLYDADKAVEMGTHIFAAYQTKVKNLLRANPVPQFHDTGTLTRLYYAGPKYVLKMLSEARSREETKHPFKDAETYVAHWRDAISVAKKHWGFFS
jgi:soluble lytic murein transglycosylase-like protein